MRKYRLLIGISLMMAMFFTAAFIDGNSVSAAGLTGEFKAFKAEDLNGNAVTEAVLSGYDLTVMNVWGTFCPPCIREMPDLGEISRQYKTKNVQIIGVVIDTLDYSGGYSSATIQKAKSIVSKTNADYLHLLPSPDLLAIRLNQVQAVPETLFIDREGKIVHSITGSRSKSEWISVIDAVLLKVK